MSMSLMALFGLDGLNLAFGACALVGGLLYLGWLVLQFMGVGDADVDVGDLDVIDSAMPDVSGTADISFTMLSFQGISSFLTMFGLGGLTLHSELGLDPFLSLAGGAAAGTATAYALGRLFSMAQRLQSSGTIDLQNAVGAEASVYMRVPPHGIGKVQLTVQGRLGIYEAISHDDEPLDTGATVRVVKVVDGSRFLVERIATAARV